MPEHAFSTDFQIEILAYLISDCAMFSSYAQFLKPEFFTEFVLQDVYTCIKDFIEIYLSTPTKAVMKEKVDRSVINNKDDQYPEHDKCIDLICEAKYNEDYIKDELKKFIKVQAMRFAIKEASNNLDDATRILNLIENVEQLTYNLDFKEGYDYATNLEARELHRAKGIRAKNQVPTGFDCLDRILEGGPGSGELNCAIAPPGQGKSIFLDNLAISAASLGVNVAYYSLEMAETLIGTRLDCRACKYTKQELIAKADKVRGQVGNLKGRIIIKGFPSGSVSSKDIARHLQGLQLLGKKIGLVLIDYADLMKSAGSFDNDRIRLKSIYEGIRGDVAQHFEIPVWTVHQANVFHEEKGKELRIIKMKHIAEAKIAVAATCDFALSINQPKSLRTLVQPKAIFYVMKHRNGLDKQEYSMLVDKSRFLFLDAPQILNGG